MFFPFHFLYAEIYSISHAFNNTKVEALRPLEADVEFEIRVGTIIKPNSAVDCFSLSFSFCGDVFSICCLRNDAEIRGVSSPRGAMDLDPRLGILINATFKKRWFWFKFCRLNSQATHVISSSTWNGVGKRTSYLDKATFKGRCISLYFRLFGDCDHTRCT